MIETFLVKGKSNKQKIPKEHILLVSNE